MAGVERLAGRGSTAAAVAALLDRAHAMAASAAACGRRIVGCGARACGRVGVGSRGGWCEEERLNDMKGAGRAAD
jgi:hypothetical protein